MQDSFSAQAQGAEFAISMMVTSGLAHDFWKCFAVDYAEGYDITILKGRPSKACLIGKEMAGKLICACTGAVAAVLMTRGELLELL